MLIGSAAGDDAGVYLLDSERALVQTADFFTPVVDDGYTYGRIAAANALSDVYAMGGRPLSALNILGYPADKVPEAVITDILRGGADVAQSAGWRDHRWPYGAQSGTDLWHGGDRPGAPAEAAHQGRGTAG